MRVMMILFFFLFLFLFNTNDGGSQSASCGLVAAVQTRCSFVRWQMEQLYPSTSFCITARTAGAAAPSQKEAYTPCAHSPTLERAQHGGAHGRSAASRPGCVGRLLGTAVFLQRLRQFMLGCREGPKKGKQTFDSSFREGTKNASFIRLFQHFNTDYWPDNRTALRPFLYAFNCEK